MMAILHSRSSKHLLSRNYMMGEAFKSTKRHQTYVLRQRYILGMLMGTEEGHLNEMVTMCEREKGRIWESF